MATLADSYRSDTPGNVIVENVEGKSLREYQLGCYRTRCILETLARVTPELPHPQIIRESGLRPDFEKVLVESPRNACRGDHIPRFLLVDLDSFRTYVVGCVGDTEKQNDHRHPVAASNVSKSQRTRPATWVHDFVRWF